MKLYRIIFIIGFSLSGLINSNLVTAQVIDGTVARQQLERTVQKMLYQERFGDLEIMANELRKTKAKFPEGAWKLLFFYQGFESPLDKSTDGWKRYLTKFDKWLRFNPNSVTARVAAGTAWMNFGWKARGSGYANTVSDEGWRLLRERLAKAFALLSEKPARQEDDCPGRYNVLLTLAMTQGMERPQYESLFHEAITFEPTYHDYYLKKAYYLMPRWHGEEGEWQRFAQAAIKLTPAKEGNAIYTRIFMSAWGAHLGSFPDPGISWPSVRQGFIDIERNNPGSPWNLNLFCQIACVAEDKETAQKLFAKIGNRPYWEVWKDRGGYQKCQALLGIKEPNVLSFNPWLDTEDFRQLLNLAESGDPYAQFQVGKKYYNCGSTTYCSSNVLSTYQQAIKWLKKAAEQGYAPAQNSLSSIYTSGSGGIKQDLDEAQKWNKAAAYQGEENAVFSMGYAYYFGGRGVVKDLLKAFIWFSQMNEQHPLKNEVLAQLTPEQLKEAELEIKKLSLQILKNKETAENK